jgi:redox-sensitive bicupin YhaK (pirin superfamily)
MIVADIQLQPNSKMVQQIPASYNTFLYVIEGSVKVGEENKILNEAQVGWLDKFSENTRSEIILTAGERGARVILYSGEPTGDRIVSYGPFTADTEEEIKQLYSDYRQNKMNHITSVSEERKIML